MARPPLSYAASCPPSAHTCIHMIQEIQTQIHIQIQIQIHHSPMWRCAIQVNIHTLSSVLEIFSVSYHTHIFAAKILFHCAQRTVSVQRILVQCVQCVAKTALCYLNHILCCLLLQDEGAVQCTVCSVQCAVLQCRTGLGSHDNMDWGPHVS